MYHIYTLSDPRTNEVRYVGMSKNAYKRFAGHLIDIGVFNKQKAAWIQELFTEEHLPTLQIVEEVETHAQALQKEKEWIGYYLLHEHASLLNNDTQENPETKLRLTYWRNIRGLSQRQLGEASGLPQGLIGVLERIPSIPDNNILTKLATALDISIEDLVRHE